MTQVQFLGPQAPREEFNMNCPSCNKPLTDRYKTIWTCDNPSCIMFNAILDCAQWKFITSNVNPEAQNTETFTLNDAEQLSRLAAATEKPWKEMMEAGHCYGCESPEFAALKETWERYYVAWERQRDKMAKQYEKEHPTR